MLRTRLLTRIKQPLPKRPLLRTLMWLTPVQSWMLHKRIWRQSWLTHNQRQKMLPRLFKRLKMRRSRLTRPWSQPLRTILTRQPHWSMLIQLRTPRVILMGCWLMDQQLQSRILQQLRRSWRMPWRTLRRMQLLRQLTRQHQMFLTMPVLRQPLTSLTTCQLTQRRKILRMLCLTWTRLFLTHKRHCKMRRMLRRQPWTRLWRRLMTKKQLWRMRRTQLPRRCLPKIRLRRLRNWRTCNKHWSKRLHKLRQIVMLQMQQQRRLKMCQILLSLSKLLRMLWLPWIRLLRTLLIMKARQPQLPRLLMTWSLLKRQLKGLLLTRLLRVRKQSQTFLPTLRMTRVFKISQLLWTRCWLTVRQQLMTLLRQSMIWLQLRLLPSKHWQMSVLTQQTRKRQQLRTRRLMLFIPLQSKRLRMVQQRTHKRHWLRLMTRWLICWQTQMMLRQRRQIWRLLKPHCKVQLMLITMNVPRLLRLEIIWNQLLRLIHLRFIMNKLLRMHKTSCKLCWRKQRTIQQIQQLPILTMRLRTCKTWLMTRKQPVTRRLRMPMLFQFQLTWLTKQRIRPLLWDRRLIT